MKEEKITGGGGRGGTDLLMECDEDEEEVCPQSKLKEKVEEKTTGPDEVKTTNDQKLEYFSLVRIIPIPVKPSSSSSSPASHDNTHNNIEGSDAPLGFKVNGQLISLPPGGGATVLKMSSNPGGSASGFTTVQLPVSPEVDNPTESWNMDNSYPSAPTAAAGLELEPTPIITGVVSGEAAQKVLSEHSANFKSRKNAPSASSRASATLSRKPSHVHSSSTTAAHYRLLKRGQLDPLPPPDCLTCKSPFKLITELRGFMCLCSPAIAESLENLKKKKERLMMKRQRRRREKRMFNSLTNPLESSSGAGLQCFSATKVISPPQKIYRLSDEFMSSRILKQEQDEPPVDTPQGKLVILVEDFYYGSVQGSNRYTVMDDGYNGPYDCIYCQSTLPDNIKLMNHILKHVTLVSNQDRIRDSVFPCHHCLRHFPSSFKRQCHIEDVHSQCETTAKCKICELSFGNEGAFLRHMKSTHKPGEMPYTCKVCNFRSSFYSDVWSHFENAHRVTKHLLCPFCLRVMSDNTCYQHHVAQHQKKHVFDCNMCRLHFLYLNERMKHKEMHHITYVKPAQLNGLKPGTKVTVRTFSMSGQSEENLKKTGPCKVVDVDPPPPRQGASKRKLVESLGELLSTLSQESESAGISHPSPRCVECLSSVQDFSTHFPSLVRCSICSFITCCSTAYANHMINNHANRSETPLYTSIYLPQPRLSDRLSCGSCSFSTYRGDVMANHLTEKQEHHCIMLQHNELIPQGPDPPEEAPLEGTPQEEPLSLDEASPDEAPSDEASSDEAPLANQELDEPFAPLDDEVEPEHEAPDEIHETSKFSRDEEEDVHRHSIKIEPEEVAIQDSTCQEHCDSKPVGKKEKVQDGHQDMTDREALSPPCDSNQQIQSVNLNSGKFFDNLQDIFSQSNEDCKSLLLGSLGCNQESSLTPAMTNRVKKETAPKLKLDTILQHIECFHPTPSHYRRDHAHNQRFFPSDVSVRFLYEEFAAKHKCSFKRFEKAVKSFDISFKRPGEEPCEVCEQQEVHVRAKHKDKKLSLDCSICRKWQEHWDRVQNGERHYRRETNKKHSDKLSVRRVDLQHVVLLPRMPGVKQALFTKRISAFHETFVSLSPQRKSISVIWHEGVALRKAVEVASAFVCVLQRETDVPHIVLWLDGCTAQNRNWCLLTTLVTVMNQDCCRTEDITLKYFEPGHTPMSEKCFHHCVETEMQEQPGGRILDFQDFRRVIEACHYGNVDVVEMQNEDIRAWKERHSRRKLDRSPPLPDLAQIQFRRGSRYMWVKRSHNQKEYIPVDFLGNKTQLSIPELLWPSEKGVGRQRKADIVKNLCPLMPPQRRQFWESLTECEEDEE